jgi:hypothetical protein
MGTINIQINKLLEAYLRKEFAAQSGIIVLNRNHPIGKFINCNTRWSKERPEPKPDSITLQVPGSPYMDQDNFYGYITLESKRIITDYIYAMFDLAIERFFVIGYRLNFRQKDIINGFMDYYGLEPTSANYEMIKKRDYRKKINVKKIIANVFENY